MLSGRLVRVCAVVVSCLGLLAGAPARADRLELVSRALPELVSDTAGAGSTLLAASTDARWVVFASSATNLVAGQVDANQADDLFLYDRDTGAITLVSHVPGSAVTTGNGASGSAASISDDGRYLAFLSQARDLNSGISDNINSDDLFLFDRMAGTVVLISRSGSSAVQAASPVISADGGFIAFQSSASNLVTGVTDTNSTSDIFLYNRSTGAMTLISRAATSATTAATGQSTLPAISADGSWVAYVSRATNLVTGATDTNNAADAFLWERATGTARIVSRANTAATTTGNAAVAAVRLGPDGSFAIFRGSGSNHVTSQSDTNGSDDLFLFDRATSGVTLVSRRGTSSTTTPSSGLQADFVFSPDGAWVAFASSAANVLNVQTEGNTGPDVFLFSRAAGSVSLVSRRAGATIATSPTDGFNTTYSMAISSDGRWISYVFPGTQMVSGQSDTNQSPDVFLFDRVAGTNALVSGAAGSATATANGGARKLVMSSDGGRIAYTSAAWDAISGVVDTNGGDDLLVWDKAANTTVLATRRDPSLPSATTGGDSTISTLPTAVSADGRYTVFLSNSSRLIPGQVDFNGVPDVFLYDRTAGTTTLVSRVPGTVATAGTSSLLAGATAAVISANGRWIAFSTDIPNLVTGDTGSSEDVFLYDRLTADLRMITRGATTGVSAGGSTPVISADGSYVLVLTRASNLVAGMSDPQTSSVDAFLFDRAAGTFQLVSHRSTAALTAAGGVSGTPQLSADGRFVTYICNSPLVPTGARGFTNVYLWDRTTNVNVLVSPSASDTTSVSSPVLSADGNWVAWVGDSSTAVTGATDTNNSTDVFLYDRTTGTNSLISHTALSAVTAGNSGSGTPVISADGAWVAFASAASNLVAGDTGTTDVFFFERSTGNIRKIPNTVNASLLSLSADGSRLAFTSSQNNLIAGQVDSNSDRDVFLVDRDTPATLLVSRAVSSSLQAGNAISTFPMLSANGEVVAFQSNASDLAADDRNLRTDVFLHIVEAAADLTISLADSPDPVGRGQSLSYGATVVNAGPGGAANVTATIGLPAGTTFAGAAGDGWTCGELGGAVTCTRPSLAVGAAPVIAIQVTTPAARGILTLAATAAVTSTTADPVAGNNGAAATTAVLQPSILVAPGTALTTTEAGGTATFSLALGSAPLAPVTISFTSGNPDEGAVAPASVTFTPGDWNTPRTVTVTGVNDDYDDGDVAFTIATSPAASTDVGYVGIDPADVAVTNTDDDTAGVLVTPTSGLTTTEAGGTATFTVALTSRPSADVTIPLASSDTAEGTVEPASLTFTTDDWSTPRTVTITGTNDDYDDGDVAFTVATSPAASTDAGYAGIDPDDVAVSNTDDDTAGVLVTPASGLTTTEAGGTATFTVVLTSRPRADVTVPLASTDTAEGTVEPASLTFTTDDWSTPRTVTVTGVNDDYDDGDVAFAIATGAAVSTDTGYAGIDPADVAVANADDDTAGFVVTPTSGLTTTEAGETATFTVSLTARPRTDVTLPLASSDTVEGTVEPELLTFTTDDWSTPKTVTVTGVDDDYDDGTMEYTIHTGAAESTDAAWAGLDPADVTVSNEDDDTSGIEVNPTRGLITTEVGGTATFTVSLAARPQSDVTIALESSDPGEGQPSPATLTFTSDNWETAQTVTVTGQDDDLRDGDVVYTIVVQPAQSGDPAFAGIDPADVTATNRDDSYEGVFYTIPLCHLIDTRQKGYGPALQSNQIAIVRVHGACGIPPTARAVALNVTFTGATSPGTALVFPGDLAQPPVDLFLPIQPSLPRSLGGVMPLGADGTLAFLPQLKSPKLNPTVHVILDVVGYFE
jgi:uncharacterized repeat protein (TIGR01451 family)